MKIDRIAAEGRNLFTGYGDGYVEVGGRRITASVLVSGELLDDWPVRSVAAITEADVAAILETKPEIVLLGSGKGFTFPEQALMMPLHKLRIGVEVMDTRAACRTFNILAQEGRNVVAALVID